jgi:hypothetical protein
MNTDIRLSPALTAMNTVLLSVMDTMQVSNT